MQAQRTRRGSARGEGHDPDNAAASAFARPITTRLIAHSRTPPASSRTALDRRMVVSASRARSPVATSKTAIRLVTAMASHGVWAPRVHDGERARHDALVGDSVDDAGG